MKILSAQIDNYISKIATEKVAGCLIFGPDEASVSFRFDIIAKKIAPNLSDPFLVANISKERLSEEKSLLLDEFYSISMFGGRKLILIKDVDANLTAAVKALFADTNFAAKSDNFILIHGGDLDKSSALRKACEDNPHFATIACYEDDERVIKKFIENELAKHQVKSSSQAIDLLFEKFGKNRQIIASELEKIIIFLGEKKELSLDLIDKLTSLESEISANEFVMNFSSKKFEVALNQAERLFKDNFEAITLLRFLSNYLQKLYHAKTEIKAGADFESAVKSQKLFFKTEIEFRKHLKINSFAFLIEKLNFLENLEIKMKSAQLSPKLIFTSFVQDCIKQNNLLNNKD